MTNKCSLVLLVAASMAVSTPSYAAKICKAKLTIPLPKAGTCSVDSTNPKMGNPFAYVDPNQACEFTFSLPGLPDLSLEGLKGSLCNLVQNVGQQAINAALAPVLSKIPTTVDLDVNSMISGMFEDQIDYQSKFCPKYSDSGKLLSYKCPTKTTAPKGQDDKDIDWGYEMSDGSGETAGGESYDTEGSDVDKNEDLPYCKDLKSLIDSNGNVVECRNSDITSHTSEDIDWDKFNSESDTETNTDSNSSSSTATKNDGDTKNSTSVGFENNTSSVSW